MQLLSSQEKSKQRTKNKKEKDKSKNNKNLEKINKKNTVRIEE